MCHYLSFLSTEFQASFFTLHAGRLFFRFYNHESVISKTKNLSVIASKWFCEVFSPQNGHVLSIRLGKDISQAVCVSVICSVCLTLCNPMDYSLPGSSTHGILQARILEWVAIPFSRRSSWPGNQTWISCIADGFFTTEPPEKPNSQATLGHFCWLMLVRSGDKNHAFRKFVLRSYDSISSKDSQNITSSPTIFHHSCSELAIYFANYIFYVS